MSAGMVSVPAIIPLKMPGLGATGSRKWSVDTRTPIEMHSTTTGCLIFFTMDGTKPDPFKRIGDKTTYQYTKAITLPTGKRTLKAVAMLKDGTKESNVNTKVFQVADAVVEEYEETEKSKLNTTWHNQNYGEEDEEFDNKMFKKVMRSSEERLPPEKKDPVRRILTDDSHTTNDSYANSGIKEDEYFLCSYCGEPRPDDPYARFCYGCNSILPPAPGKFRSPRYTGSFQNALRKSPNPKKKIECKNCGTSNPVETSECLVCDSPLSGISVSKLKKGKAPEPSTNFIVCPCCTRVNSGNARFCDWCGEKSNSTSRTVSCQRCMTENIVSSQYCCSCGENLVAPPRESLEKILDQGDLKIKESISRSGGLEKSTEEDKQSWKNIEFESVTRKQSKNVAIQAGDSVISAMQKLALKEQGTNSPGKGFWRQQVDYVAQHFKVYIQNNVNFRAQFSNQTLSNLLSVELHEAETEENVKELVLTFSVPAENTKPKKNKKMKAINSGETLINAMKQSSRPSSGRSRPSSGKSRPSSATIKQQRSDVVDSSSPRSNHSDSRPSSGRKPKMSQKALEKEKLNAFYAKLSPDTKKLLNLIKATKEADVDEVDSLLDSDEIDINSTDENGTPLLKLAVQNKHFDILQSLIIAGADINAISGTKSTTALHESVMLGMAGKDAIEILLDNDASYTIQDKRGKSAHDLAIDNGANAILSIFNQHTSKGLLKDVMKL